MSNNLSLKQLEKSGIHRMMSDKERDKAILAAINQQKGLTTEVHQKDKPKDFTLDEVLVKGGATTILHNGNKYRISVLTEEQLAVYDNLNSYNTCDDVVELPPLYKYWCKLILGGVFTVKCGSYKLAQDVVDNIFGVGRYSISASKL